MLTVSIIEDDVRFGLMLKKLIESQEDMVCLAIFQNIKSALQALPSTPSDIVLLDIQLPDGFGSEYLPSLKKISPNTQFIMCTSFEDNEYIFTSLQNGASGYLIKTETPENIISAIHDIQKGGAPMSKQIAKKVIQYFNTKNTFLDILSPKENEVLLLLSKGYLYKEIGITMGVGIDTIKKHASSVYKKLNVTNRTEAINKLNLNQEYIFYAKKYKNYVIS